MRRSILLLSIFNVLFVAKAQFKMDLEFRPRSEYRDGYQTLSEPNEQGVFLTTQRTRLNVSFNYQKRTETFISFQDIRTWGQVGLNSRESTINLYQAWVKFNLADRLNLKVGRQEFEYDDLKILSNSTWRMQARSHDAGLLEWKNKDSTLTVHLAGAVNNEGEVLFQDLYEVSGTYKNMGMLWLNKQLKSTELSLLFLDLGQQQADTTINHFRTMGIYGVQQMGKLKLTGSFYLQRGRNQADLKVASQMTSLNLRIPITEKFSVTPGFDILSGTSAENLENPNYGETNTFIPLYARRHRYFGVQDMFYAGGFNVPGGLVDYFIKLDYKLSNKWRTRVQMHSFSTQESIQNFENASITNDKHLGYEIDTFVDFNPYKSLSIGLGYTHFFATESMRLLKQRGSENEIAQFAYLQIQYTPVLFKN